MVLYVLLELMFKSSDFFHQHVTKMMVVAWNVSNTDMCRFALVDIIYLATLCVYWDSSCRVSAVQPSLLVGKVDALVYVKFTNKYMFKSSSLISTLVRVCYNGDRCK